MSTDMSAEAGKLEGIYCKLIPELLLRAQRSALSAQRPAPSVHDLYFRENVSIISKQYPY